MLKLEKARVKELEGQMKQMSIQLDQHEMALHQQMEQQRLRWKSEIVSSNSMLNAVGLGFLFFFCKKHTRRFGVLLLLLFIFIVAPRGSSWAW